MNGRLLTTREVAELLGVSPETVLRWARAGKLPAVYLSSRAIRFREEELEEWLGERTSATVDSAFKNGTRRRGNVDRAPDTHERTELP